MPLGDDIISVSALTGLRAPYAIARLLVDFVNDMAAGDDDLLDQPPTPATMMEVMYKFLHFTATTGNTGVLWGAHRMLLRDDWAIVTDLIRRMVNRLKRANGEGHLPEQLLQADCLPPFMRPLNQSARMIIANEGSNATVAAIIEAMPEIVIPRI